MSDLRIEQLERELAAEKEAHKACEFMMRTNASMAADLALKLAAEKELADRLHFALTNHENADINAVFAAYRKARGL